MDTNTVRRRGPARLLQGCGLAAAFAAGAGRASAGDPPRDAPRDETRDEIAAIWNDPVFQKQFVGGYGINSEIEPRVTPAEVKILETVRPLMASDLKKAAETLRASMKPDCSAILDYTLGSIAFQQDDLDNALRGFNKAVEKFPSFRRAWRNLGLLFVRNSNWDAAIGAFIKMLELGGGDAYAYGSLGFAFSAKQDYQPAEAAFRNALLLQPDSTRWRLGLTNCAFKQGKFADCEALLDVLIARYPDKAEFWLLQANTFINLKQPLKAAQNFEAVDRLGKSTLDSLYTLGEVYSREGLPELAVGAFLRALDLDPAQPVARPLEAAERLTVRNSNEQAKQVAKRIHEKWDASMEPADQRKLLKLEARIATSEGGGTVETAALLEEIVRLDPLDGDALLLLGQHYQRKDDPDRAMFYYERAEGLPSFEQNAKIRHAQVLVGLARYADAVPLLRRSQEIKPRDDIARYLEQVERNAKAKR
jgi:tetratricopeptide (TPR) repeat protein